MITNTATSMAQRFGVALADVPQSPKRCARMHAQISDKPEADARAAFARGEEGQMSYLFLGFSPVVRSPGSSRTLERGCATGSKAHSRRIFAGTDSDADCPFFEAAEAYVKRYNLEITRLCASATGH